MSRSYLAAYGTRPEAIKLAPLVNELRTRGNTVVVVDTGQHKDANMNSDLATGLGMSVDIRLHAAGPADILDGAARVIAHAQPEAVLLLGDTSTVPLYSWASRAAGKPVIHVEAGMRSLNGRSLEEVNRRMAAMAASVHFTPTDLARNFLLREGIEKARVYTVGNTITDTLRLWGPQAAKERTHILATAHRASNVDNPARLARIVEMIIGASLSLPVLFPLHPRTRAQLEAHGLDQSLKAAANVEVSGPLDYESMLTALSGARAVITDSGGVQEECAWYHVPSLVLRRSTPRWESVRDGLVYLQGIDSDEDICDGLRKLESMSLADYSRIPCPYGDGHVSERIASILASDQVRGQLELREDDVDMDQLPW